MRKRKLELLLALSACVICLSCGGGKRSGPPSGLKNRVLASQGVTSTSSFGAVYIINAQNDTIPRVSPLSAGSSPGVIAVSPTRNVAATFDSASNTVYAFNTTKEAAINNGIHILGATSSMVIPNASPIVYAAVPTATVNGFSFIGAVEAMNFSTGALTTIAVDNAQTVEANSNGTQLLVFSGDSDVMTVITPGLAAPPVDTGCSTPPNTVCTLVTGFDRPVDAVVNGSTAYVLNCGPQCGGTQASVMVVDLPSLSITQTIPVDAATVALLSGSTLYVAGTPTTNNDCSGQSTKAKICGRLDIVDLGSGTVSGHAVITDGYHQRISITNNNQIFIGARGCTNIGNVNNPSGEVRGCLSIFNTGNGTVLIPPDNGDVTGLQAFGTRFIEYVAEGGALRVYDTTKDALLINDFLPQGTINIVGYVGDVKAIDFF